MAWKTKRPEWAEPKLEKKADWMELVLKQAEVCEKFLTLGYSDAFKRAVEGLYALLFPYVSFSKTYKKEMPKLEVSFNRQKNSCRSRYGNNEERLGTLTFNYYLKKYQLLVHVMFELRAIPQMAEYEVL